VKRRVLFLTDDREGYSQGGYHHAYQLAFQRQTDSTLCHPLDPLPNLDDFDLVVLGHSTMGHFARLPGKRFLPAPIRHRLWFRHAALRALRRTRTPVVLFTMNDYKLFDVKNAFISYVRPRLVVTHTQRALNELRSAPGGTLAWLPFGVDDHRFSPPSADDRRPFDVGFRANDTSTLSAGQRGQFFRALTRLENRRSVSLTLTKYGQGFLVGQPYVDWIRSCTLVGNTVSAAGTVGPRFLEAMACGSVPIAPRALYEGLLAPDVHYIPIDSGTDNTYPTLEATVARFFDDRVYQQQLHEGGQRLVREHTVDQHALKICRDLGV
jgi:glycosyltransferase involved in cell wall biosynthesis